MKRLSRAARMPRIGGQPLPRVFHSLPPIRRGEMTIIAGESNAGKSLLALWHAQKWVLDFGLRGIYFSADSAALGQAARALAMSTVGVTSEEALDLIQRHDEWALEQLDRLSGLFWSFDEDLSYSNMQLEVEAFIELWGCNPDFVIVDNLTDVEGQAEDEFGMLRRASKALTALARETDAGVVVLHHTLEDVKADPCPPKKALAGKVSQKPGLIFTTADHGDKRPVAVVKDRYQRGVDKTGQTAVWLRLNQENLHYSEM